MKISIMSYTMEVGGWDFSPRGIRDLCRFACEHGIDGIDWCSVYGVAPGDVRKIMDDHGLRTVCYTQGADLNFPDRAGRLPGLETVLEICETAATLGTDKIMIPMGGKGSLSPAESRTNIIQGLSAAVEIADTFGLTVTIEHMHGISSPFVTSVDINEAIDAVPGLRVTFDSGNCLTGGEQPQDAFARSKDSIVHVHFKDWTISPDTNGIDGSDGRYYLPALIGEGIVDHEAVISKMAECGYDGYINIEYQSTKYDSKYAVSRASRYILSLLDKIPVPIQ